MISKKLRTYLWNFIEIIVETFVVAIVFTLAFEFSGFRNMMGNDIFEILRVVFLTCVVAFLDSKFDRPWHYDD